MKNRFFLTAFCLLLCFMMHAQTIIYVKTGATGANNGTSWANAYTNLNTALTAAPANSQLWVAQGTYQPASGSFFVMKNDVGIYGGFAGTETLLTQRNSDPATNNTILQGNGHSVIRNAYPVTGPLFNTAILDGFTVKGGNTTVSSGQTGYGGGIYNRYASPVLRNLRVMNNNAVDRGGGIANSDSSSPTIQNVLVSGNTSGSGGGIFMTNSSPTLTDVIVTSNSASATSGNGGGVYIGQNSSPALLRITISNNTANLGGGICVSSNDNVTLTDVNITGNSASLSGTGMYCGSTGSPKFLRVKFTNNTGTGTSTFAAVVCSEGSPVFSDVLISQNNVAFAAAIFCTSATSASFTNVTIAKNTCTSTNVNNGCINVNGSTPTFSNCILYDNVKTGNVPASVYLVSGGNPLFQNSLIQGSGGSSAWNSAFGTNGGANIDVNPQFVSATDFSLQNTSPAINAGNNSLHTNPSTIDLAGNVRIQNGIIDMGAYEKATACASTSSTFIVSACGSYTWANGVTYTASNNTATRILTNAAGCDSTIYLNLTIKQPTSSVTNISACSSYTWTNGVTYTTSGTRTQTLTNAVGCDSVATLNLIIKQPTSSTTNISACSSYTWTNGITYTTSGIRTRTLTNAAGCDSIATLNLIIRQPTSSTTNISACSSYTWTNGITYTTSGIRTRTLTNAAGCDSIATLNLIIKQPTSSTTNISACSSYTWTNGVTYTTSGTRTQILTNAVGCDSIATLNLIIKQPTSSTTNISACSSYTWTNGVTYTTSGTRTQILTNAVGCDSIATLNLIIRQPTSSTFTVSACVSYTWANGVTYTANNNTATRTITNAAGCDSVIHLNLTIKQPSSSTTNISVCSSYTWTNGVTYTTSGTRTQTLTNAVGCDSIATLNLIIKQPTSSTFTVAACGSYTWANGVTYTANNNTATRIITNAAGCDSVIHLNLTIKQPTSSVTNISVCSSYTWTNGVTYTTSGTRTQTLTNAVGCDSIATLNLIIKQPTSSTFTHSACGSYTWANGVTYTASNNTATRTLTNAAGCDSVIHLNLTINQPTSGTFTHTACNSYTWINGVTYTANNNTATHTLINAAGCDSVVHLNLTISQTVSGTFTHSACGSYTWINGVTYTSSNNTATHMLTSVGGCDSIVHLNLTINQPTSGTFTHSACGSYTWINGVTYTSSNNTATHTLTNSAGCDSVVHLNLTINQPTSGTFTHSSCGSYTWIDGVTYTSSNNTATHMLTNAAGCDSIVHLNLTITNVISTVSQSGITLTANQSGAAYQWINCGQGNTPIPNATGQSFTAATNGTYAVQITLNGCTEVSDCITIATVGIGDIEKDAMRVYPNPTSKAITVEFGFTGEVLVSVFDALGQLVTTENANGTSCTIDLEQQQPGVYFVKCTGNNDQPQTFRVVKN